VSWERLFESSLAWLGSSLLALTVASVLAAMAGMHRSVLILPLAAVLTVFIRRGIVIRTGARSPLTALHVAVLMAIVVTSSAFAVANHAELVLTGRDGATYTTTARFLIDGDDLLPQAVEEPFSGLSDLEFQAPGFVVRDDGRFWQQFLHASPALYATLGELFGPRAIFVANPLISGLGLISLFAVTRRFLTNGWSLVAVAALAATLPFVYFSRATFSETLSLTFGALGLAYAVDSFTVGRGERTAGLFLGATALVRVDGWTAGLALVAVGVVTAILGGETRALRRAWTSFAIIASLGLLDIALFAPQYASILGMRMVGLVGVTVLGAALMPLPLGKVRRFLPRSPIRTGVWANLGAITVAAVGLFALWIRPVTMEGHGPTYGLASIQQTEGLAVEATRSYSELSLQWMSWYVGVATVLLAIAALAVIVHRAIDRHSWDVPSALALAFFAVPAAIYLAQPSVNPDHIWATRRFLPVILPGLIILATWMVSQASKRASGPGRGLTAAAGVAAILIPPIPVTAPFMGTAEWGGAMAAIEDTCDNVPAGSAVLFLDTDPDVPLSYVFGPPLRAWCGVSVAGTAHLSDSQRRDLIHSGAGVVVVSVEPTLVGPAAEPFFTLETSAYEHTLSHAPEGTERILQELWMAPLETIDPSP
jgi:hypothetical protein